MWVKTELEKEMNPVGYIINRVLVTDIEPSPQVRQAMDAINIANRNQVSAKAQGEAERIKVVAAATAQAEAKKLQGEGIANERIAIAKGFREAIELIKESAEVSGREAYTMLLFTNIAELDGRLRALRPGRTRRFSAADDERKRSRQRTCR
jgi:regulator of protease activity HflC (stomatin/prohibitin superfamily)